MVHLVKRYVTESEMSYAVDALMPTMEINHCSRRELAGLALEHFADELGVIANVSAARVVASRVLAAWEGVKMQTKREVGA
jgi:hypothetical protein